MGIPIFDELEKLINEHGSANILRERNAFAKDQYAALEKKTIELEREVGIKDTEIIELEAENERLKLHNAELTKQMGVFNEPYKNNDHHPADRILLFLCYKPDASETEIATGVNVAPLTVKHWLAHFRQIGQMLDSDGHITGSAVHYLSKKGLA